VLATMSDEQRVDPRFFPDNYESCREFFRQRYDCKLAAYDGRPPPLARNNATGGRRWWSASGCTLDNVLAHIEGGNFAVLGMPLPTVVPSVSRRHRSSWMPRWMASSSSSGSASSSSYRSCGSAPPSMPRTSLRAVKKEPAFPPQTRGRSSGALVIREGGTRFIFVTWPEEEDEEG
jgi:hypothetical protein